MGKEVIAVTNKLAAVFVRIAVVAAGAMLAACATLSPPPFQGPEPTFVKPPPMSASGVALVLLLALGFVAFGWYWTEKRPLGRTVLQVDQYKVSYAGMKRLLYSSCRK